jgi:divalent metal cation (Fe/Co/Zn/Cd) transporter
MNERSERSPSILPAQSERLALIHEAFRLEWFTMGWMTIEAGVSVAAGLTASSLVLLAFGLDSVIELASAGVLMWRLSVELRQGQKFSERAERIASRVGGALLFLLATYVTAGAVWNLWERTGQEFSLPVSPWSQFPLCAIWRNARSPLPKRSEAGRFAPTRLKP